MCKFSESLKMDKYTSNHLRSSIHDLGIGGQHISKQQATLFEEHPLVVVEISTVGALYRQGVIRSPFKNQCLDGGSQEELQINPTRRARMAGWSATRPPIRSERAELGDSGQFRLMLAA